MSETATVPAPTVIPVVDYLRIGDRPTLTGFRCAACDAVYLLRRSACASCGAADFSDRVDLADHGVVTAATVVHRAPPGVVTPFVSGVVALDGGGYVRTNLVGDVDDPVAAVGLPARLITHVVATDSRATDAVGFQFEVGSQPGKQDDGE